VYLTFIDANGQADTGIGIIVPRQRYLTIHPKKELHMQIITDLSNGVRNIANYVLHPMAVRRSYTLEEGIKVVRSGEDSHVTQGPQQRNIKDVKGDEDGRVAQRPVQAEVTVVKGYKDRSKTPDGVYQFRDSGFDMGRGTYRRTKSDFFDPENEVDAPESPRTQKTASGSSHFSRVGGLREVLMRNRKESAEVPQENVDDAVASSSKMPSVKGNLTSSHDQKMSA
jgi:hypothetical protein